MTDQPADGVRKMDQDLKHRISQMIEEEQDTKARIQLMLMARVVDFLGDNIKAVRSIMTEFKTHERSLDTFHAEFQKHLEEHEQITSLVDQGKGGWKVAAVASVVIGVLVNVLISTLYIGAMNDIASLKTKSVELLVEVEKLKSSRAE